MKWPTTWMSDRANRAGYHPHLDERPRHSRWIPSTPSAGTTAALFVHGGVCDAAMGRSYRWIPIDIWIHATGKTIGCYVGSIWNVKMKCPEIAL